MREASQWCQQGVPTRARCHPALSVPRAPCCRGTSLRPGTPWGWQEEGERSLQLSSAPRAVPIWLLAQGSASAARNAFESPWPERRGGGWADDLILEPFLPHVVRSLGHRKAAVPGSALPLSPPELQWGQSGPGPVELPARGGPALLRVCVLCGLRGSPSPLSCTQGCAGTHLSFQSCPTSFPGCWSAQRARGMAWEGREAGHQQHSGV